MTASSEATGPIWDCAYRRRRGARWLNGALVLGLARRRVLVLDNGSPRNYATHEMHGVLDTTAWTPRSCVPVAMLELARYGVEVVTVEVQEAEVLDGAVRVTCAGRTEVTRTLLLATGMLDEVPDIPGFADIWGTSAHACPYCDGFEHRDERLAVLAEAIAASTWPFGQWSDDVVLLSDGPHECCRRATRAGAGGRRPRHRDAGRRAGQPRRASRASGSATVRATRRAVLLRRLAARNHVACTLGCELRDDGSVAVDANQATTIDRVYAAGNCAEPRALVPAAAGSGATAAVAINARLRFEAADIAVARSATAGRRR